MIIFKSFFNHNSIHLMTPTCSVCKINNVRPTKTQSKNGPTRFTKKCDPCTKKAHEDWLRFKFNHQKTTRSIATQTDQSDDENVNVSDERGTDVPIDVKTTNEQPSILEEHQSKKRILLEAIQCWEDARDNMIKKQKTYDDSLEFIQKLL